MQKVVNILSQNTVGMLIILCSATVFAYSPLSPYENNELKTLEKQFVEQINASPQVIRDPLATQYINSLSHRLIRKSNIEEPILFFIVKSPDINAFAGPGGYIGINSQLILTTRHENELAAVMAHEIAHVHLHHLYQFIEHQKAMRLPMLASVLASLALGVVNPTLGSGALMASLSGGAQDTINFTRSNEQQADRIGIRLLKNAGFDPKGMVEFFSKLQEQSRYSSASDVPTLLRTHPLDEDRISEALNRIDTKQMYTTQDAKSYTLFKELVRVSSVNDPKALLDYYHQGCIRNNTQEACQYGLALALLKSNQFTQAHTLLLNLRHNAPNQIDYGIALAESELGLTHFSEALTLLSELHENYPDSYAITLSFAQSLITAHQAARAYKLLLQANRQFKHDLLLCDTLADAIAKNHQPAMAYFTEAQCDLERGNIRLAMNRLHQAKKLAQKDVILQSRIKAKMDEITSNQ